MHCDFAELLPLVVDATSIAGVYHVVCVVCASEDRGMIEFARVGNRSGDAEVSARS